MFNVRMIIDIISKTDECTPHQVFEWALITQYVTIFIVCINSNGNDGASF